MARGTPPKALHLAHLRASQINGCGACVDGGVKQARQGGETEERLFAVSAWRDTPCFTDAERAALALTEAMPRLDDRMDPVPDEVWAETAKHHDERALGGLVLWIATTNLFNRPGGDHALPLPHRAVEPAPNRRVPNRRVPNRRAPKSTGAEIDGRRNRRAPPRKADMIDGD